MPENKQRYIEIDGESVPVTEEVYLAYKRPLWAERKRYERESRCRDENGNRCMDDCRLCDKKRDGGDLSFEKCVEDGHEAADTFDLSEYVEEKLLKEALGKAVASLTDDERRLIEAAFNGKPERDNAAELGIHRNTFVYRRDKIVEKLREMLT